MYQKEEARIWSKVVADMAYLHHWPNVLPDPHPFLSGLCNKGKEHLMMPVCADSLSESEDAGLW